MHTSSKAISILHSSNQEEQNSYSIRLVSRLVSLAGLLHDIGKTTVVFQALIHAAIGEGVASETYRHEAVSGMMLAWLNGQGSDSGWILHFIEQIDKGLLDKRIREALRVEIKKHSTNSRFACAEESSSRNTPALFSLVWLITAHHHLPSGDITDNAASINSEKHFRNSPRCAPPKQLVSDGLPWLHDAWVSRLRADLESLHRLISEPEFLQVRDFLFDYMRLIGRPALQLGDHIVSSDKRPATAPCRTYAFANSVVTEGGFKMPGQRLHSHLIAVSRKAAQMVPILSSFRKNIPGIPDHAIPKALRKKSADISFAWQDQAANSIHSNRNGVHDSAFFGAMIAGVGTGKTIGAMKVMAAFKTPLRVVYASPYRSLTLQSGAEFSAFGFEHDDITTVVGDPLIRALHFSKVLEPNITPEATLESIGDLEMDHCDIDTSGGNCSLDTLEEFDFLSHFKEGERNMIVTPVLAATLDTVMKLADGRRGSYLSHLLRVASSDMVIDEIDKYETQDLLAIGRLVEAAGFWRSRVLLSSATLSPVIAQTFLKAYQHGLRIRDALDGVSTQLFGGWFSDSADSLVTKIQSAEKFNELHKNYSIAVTNVADECKRAIVGFLPRVPLASVAKQALRGSKHLHAMNAVTLPDGRNFSFGCVQVVNVRSCQRIALDLAALAAKGDSDVDFRVICLHGRMSLASKNWLDTRLNTMLRRKGAQGDLAPLKDPFIRAFVEGSTKKDMMVILVSTQETTGRDHDFDWGIIESRRERDIIQFAGRIRRHRPKGKSNSNMLAWDFPLPRSNDDPPWAAKTETDTPPCYQKFGLGDQLQGELKGVGLRRSPAHKEAERVKEDAKIKTGSKEEKHREEYLKKYINVPRYKEMLGESYGHNVDGHIFITSRRVLVDEMPSGSEWNGDKTTFTVRACETLRLKNTLQVERASKYHTLSEWLRDENRAGRLLCKHQDTYRFRHSQVSGIYWRDETGDWFFSSEPWKALQTSQKQNSVVGPMKIAEAGLLFSINEDEVINNIMEITGFNGQLARLKLSSIEVPAGLLVQANGPSKLQYHPQIGMSKTTDLC